MPLAAAVAPRVPSRETRTREEPWRPKNSMCRRAGGHRKSWDVASPRFNGRVTGKHPMIVARLEAQKGEPLERVRKQRSVKPSELPRRRMNQRERPGPPAYRRVPLIRNITRDKTTIPPGPRSAPMATAGRGPDKQDVDVMFAPRPQYQRAHATSARSKGGDELYCFVASSYSALVRCVLSLNSFNHCFRHSGICSSPGLLHIPGASSFARRIRPDRMDTGGNTANAVLHRHSRPSPCRGSGCRCR